MSEAFVSDAFGVFTEHAGVTPAGEHSRSIVSVVKRGEGEYGG
jgi:hypothetical protein